MFRILIVTLLTTGAAFAGTPEFAGRWKLDKTHSELSGRMKTKQSEIDQVLKITLTETRLIVVTETIGGPAEKAAVTETYALDGKQHEFAPAGRTGSLSATGVRTATRVEGSPEIVVQEDVSRLMKGGPIDVHNTHTWTLSADGRTLTVHSVIKGPQGEIPTTRRFVRAEPPVATAPSPAR